MVVVVAALLAGCAGGTGSSPSASPTPSITASAPAKPPLAGDLTGGTPLQLGGVGHWAIAAGRAYVATDSNTVTATDLATGNTVWQASFTKGKPWDAQPKLGLSADHSTVVIVRTVDIDGGARLDLLLVDAASGATKAEHLISDPERDWEVDLPPSILAADAATIVLAADPESGRQTAVVRVADGTLAWVADEQTVAATADLVVTRNAGRARDTGTILWKAAKPIGPLLAQGRDVLVVGQDATASWLDPATGLEITRTATLGEVEPPCVATSDVLVCVEAAPTGYDLATGKELWVTSEPATGVAILGDWAYVWRKPGRGDVLDARTGQVLVTDAALPSIRYADRTGILLSTDNGYTWAPYPR